MQSSFDYPAVYQVLHSFINDSSKLCTPQRLPLDILKQLLPPHHHQIENLKSEFESVRIFNNDGNTFYRCVGISFLEYLCRSTTDPSKFSEFLNNYKSNSGYMACREISWETRNIFIGLLEHLLSFKNSSSLDILRALDHSLQILETDAALVNEMRSLTANYILANSSNKFFESYSRDLNTELSNILTRNRECSELVYSCLSSALGVYIKIISLQPYSINIYGLISHRAPIIVILKSNRYDILYSYAMNRLNCYDSSMMDYTRYILTPEQIRECDEKLYWVNRVYLDCGHGFYKVDILSYIREVIISRNDASSAIKCSECMRSTPIDHLLVIKSEIQEIMDSISLRQTASIPARLPNLQPSAPTNYSYHYLIPQIISNPQVPIILQPNFTIIAQLQTHNNTHTQLPKFSQPQGPNILESLPQTFGYPKVRNIPQSQPIIIPHPQVHNIYHPEIQNNSQIKSHNTYQPDINITPSFNLAKTYRPAASTTSQSYTYTTDALHYEHLDSLLNCRISASGSARIELEALKRSFTNEEIKARLDFMMYKYDSFR